MDAQNGPPPKCSCTVKRNGRGRPSQQFLQFKSEEDRYHTSHRLEPLLASLEARLRAGQVIYLHCWGGRGRAGTVGACLLARMYGLGAEEALDRVQRAYSTRKDPDREFIPTREYGAAPAVHICKPCFAQVGGVGSAA